MAGGTLVMLLNIWVSVRKGEEAGDNPWEGFTLSGHEFTTAGRKLAVIPEVASFRPVWDLDHPGVADAEREPTPADTGGDRTSWSPVRHL